MAGPSGPATFVRFLIATVLFPFAWLRLWRRARQVENDMPRSKQVVAGAIVVSLVLTGVGAWMLQGFQQDNVDGMYDQMETRLAIATKETDYQDNLVKRDAAVVTLEILARNLADAQASGDEAAMVDIQNRTATTQKNLQGFEAMIASLEDNHALYEGLVPYVTAKDDDAVRDRVGAFVASLRSMAQAAQQAGDEDAAKDARSEADFIERKTDSALRIKDSAIADMDQVLLWLLWPGLIGVFFAPLVWAEATLLRSQFRPSETVGFRPYPGTSMSWFLLLGALGWPSVVFAAWAAHDMDVRWRVGQISL